MLSKEADGLYQLFVATGGDDYCNEQPDAIRETQGGSATAKAMQACN